MNDDPHDSHSSPIKTPKQLAIVVVLAFAIPIALITIITQLVTTQRSPAASEDERKVLARIQPVGTVVLAAPAAAKGSMTGEQVYGQICKTCHEAGLAGAPKVGDKAAWAPRIAQGEKTLVQHAVAGYQGKSGVMPPKGGNADLTDEEVQRAVAFMANQAGAGFKEAPVAATNTAAAAPAPATSTGAPIAAATSPSSAAASSVSSAPPTQVAAAPSAAAAPAAKAASVDGKAVFEGTCQVCHGAGIAGAPKVGDKAAWAPRIAEGAPTLYQHALNGFQGKNGVMPPKGGNNALTEPQVKAAVDYMIAQSK
jgi:cytochrome c5